MSNSSLPSRRHAGSAALLLASVLAGCFKDLDALAPFPCALDSSCPSGFVCVDAFGCVPADTCDVDRQSCPSGAGSKCTVVRAHDQVDHTTCLATTGSNGLGEPCAREDLGLDDCAAGLFCNSGLSPDGQFACRSFCAEASDCPTGFVCAGTFSPVSAGICVPGCSPGDTTCGVQRSCRQVGLPGASAFACTADGTAGEWQPCGADVSCGHGLSCSDGTQGFCFALCSAAAPCANGQSCVTGGQAVGVCECNALHGCPEGMSCRPEGSEAQGVFGECIADGPGALGASCSTDTDCGADLSCWGSQENGYFCTQICDAAVSSCQEGSCHALNGLPDGGGVCE